MIVYIAYAAILIAPTAFVAYWSGVAAENRRLRQRLHQFRATTAAEKARVENLMGAIIEAERRFASHREGARLTAAEIDAWHELVAHEDEAA